MDIDGTLLDSNRAQAESWLRVLQDFGYQVDYQQVRSRIGLGQAAILHDLCGVSEASPRARRLLPVRELILRTDYLPSLAARSGVLDFLRRARTRGAQLAVVTSACRSEALALLGAGRLLTEFDHVVCKEDVSRAKPAPDGMQLALARMGVAPEHAIAIATSPHDVTAARAAQVGCVVVRSGWAQTRLPAELPVYEHLHQVLPGELVQAA